MKSSGTFWVEATVMLRNEQLFTFKLETEGEDPPRIPIQTEWTLVTVEGVPNRPCINFDKDEPRVSDSHCRLQRSGIYPFVPFFMRSFSSCLCNASCFEFSMSSAHISDHTWIKELHETVPWNSINQHFNTSTLQNMHKISPSAITCDTKDLPLLNLSNIFNL